jgi:hypothetical protein
MTMSKGDKKDKKVVLPRRLMTKVRKKFHKPTRAINPNTIYNRNKEKRELQEIIDEECTCLRMVCECGAEDYYGDVGVSEEG